MTPPEVDSPFRPEWELMHQLRDAPRLLELVERSGGDELRAQTQLRREYADRLVSAAFSLVELRRKAARKFTRAAQMWFDRQGLEQATSEAVARHKARRFHGDVCDLCCGIGGDALALAGRCEVRAVDSSPLACLRTEWNAAVYGVESRVQTICADACQAPIPPAALVHIDPDRRAHGAGRVVRVEDYHPGLAFLQQLAREARGGAIKLSPAANFGGKFRDVEIELVSLEGECKEATIWFGELAGDAPFRATALPSGETLAGHPLDFVADEMPPQAFIFDPDPAVVRAGLVDACAVSLGLARLDREDEYLTGAEPVASPFVQPFELLADLPNNPTEIRAYFRSSRAGQVEIKCRHVSIDAEVIRRRLPLPGDEPVVLIFARVAGRARALVCRRLAHAGSGPFSGRPT